MRATRDRRGDLDEDRAAPAWDERPILGQSRGLPWWGAIVLAFGVTAVAAVIDMQTSDTLGTLFQSSYIAGCVAAICLVRRRNLFGPIVQPPLVFAVVFVSAFVLLGQGAGEGLKGLLFNVALPMTDNFPTMAITAGVVLLIGLGRLFLQRKPVFRGEDSDEPPVRRTRPSADEPRRRPAGDERKPRPAEDRKRPAEERKPKPTDERRPRPAQERTGERKPRPAQDRARKPRDEPPERRAKPEVRRPARDEDRRPRRPRPER